jgi:CheY-like chemotaxis protein
VLIIDDGAEARDMYSACLNYYGLDAECAEDGLTGLVRAGLVRPDLIVLDFSMPNMDGHEVLRRLKERASTRNIPVVMVTAIPELVTPSARAQCAALLEKPCEPDRLVLTIAGILQGRAGPKAPAAAPG